MNDDDVSCIINKMGTNQQLDDHWLMCISLCKQEKSVLKSFKKPS